MIAPGNATGRQEIIRDGFAKASRTNNWRVKQLKSSGTRASTRKKAETVSPRQSHDVTQRPRTKWTTSCCLWAEGRPAFLGAFSNRHLNHVMAVRERGQVSASRSEKSGALSARLQWRTGQEQNDRNRRNSPKDY